MENAEVLLKTLDTLLCWPMVFAAVAIVFLFLFKAPIANLLNKIKRISGRGSIVDLEDSPLEKGRRYNPNEIYKDINDSYTSPLAKENKKNIVKLLNEANITSDNNKIDLLIHELAHQQMLVHYWFLRYWLGAERKKLLRAMNADNGRIDLSYKKTEIEKYYNQYVQRINNQDIERDSFEAFVGFLVSSQLIAQSSEGGYNITIKGNDFLTFLTRVRDVDC